MIGVVPGDPYYLSSLYPGEGSAVWDYIVDQMKNIKEKKPTAFCDRLSDKTKIFKAMFYRDEEKIRVV